MDAHSERKHALLSPSGAHRWLRCTPAAVLEEKFGKQTSTAFSREGTLAHELAELELRKHFKLIEPSLYKLELKAIKSDSLYSDEMPAFVEVYTNFVIENFNELKTAYPDTQVLIEAKVPLSKYTGDGEGTCDNILIGNRIMKVDDLKYGKGVKVDADNNEQLMLYALGALEAHGFMHDIEWIEMSIIQPRLNHISTWKCKAEYLLNWGLTYVKPKAELARYGLGDLNPGEKQCRFCKVKNRCAALAEESLKIANYDFAEPSFLEDFEISAILDSADAFINWIGSIRDYAFDQALNHEKKWPGYKLVAGRSNRKIIKESEVIEKLKSELYDEDHFITKKLKGITDLQKMLGGAKMIDAILGEYIVKPPGAPALVPESDPRDEISAVNRALEDFGE